MTRAASPAPLALALALCLTPIAAPAAQANSAIAIAPAAVASDPTAPDAAALRHPRHAPGDPLEGFNRKMFSLQWKIDKAIIRPVSMGAKQVLPQPARSGIRNFFTNLSEAVVFLNDLLQLRPGRAVRTLARFTLNTTVGIGGLFDVAKNEGLPHRSNGLGKTLARYGFQSGPYLFLPFLGPSTLLDLIGDEGDYLTLPLSIGKPFGTLRYDVPHTLVSGMIQRIDSDDMIKALFQDTMDPYAAMRSAYLQSRAAALRLNRAAGPGLEDQDIPFEDELLDPGTTPAAAGDSGTAPAPDAGGATAVQPAPALPGQATPTPADMPDLVTPPETMDGTAPAADPATAPSPQP